MPIPRLVIAGQSSGVGKTTVTLGLIAALRARGLAVQPFKCGPDYIDPSYHTLAAGRACRNLDTWMLAEDQVVASFERACEGADIALIEGVMGLYDGASFDEEQGSGAHIAKLLRSPVLLTLDIGKLARTAAALALGFQAYDPALELAGLILNYAGSEGHAKGCMQAIQQVVNVPVLGWLYKNAELHIPERHLGLIPSDEGPDLSGLMRSTKEAVAETFDLDGIVRRVECLSDTRQPLKSGTTGPRRVSTCTASPLLAVARDEAFSFYYPDNLDLLEAAGAKIHFFSPLAGEVVPEETAGVYLGGGFPEVYAERLSRNRALWEQLHRLHAAGAPIYAECGGFMALTEALVDLEGVRWAMAGLVPGETQMQERLAGLGYRRAIACGDNLLLQDEETVRGHEFHYSSWQVDLSGASGRSAWRLQGLRQAAGSCLSGYADGSLLASYLHIHFGQNTSLAERFVEQMCKVSAK